MPLFRAEAERAREQAWLGGVVLAQPLSFAVLTAVAIGLAILMATYFIAGDYTRKARIQGSLAPAEGLVRVVARQPGHVRDLGVTEGEQIAADALLLRVVDDRAEGSRVGEAIRGQIRQRQQALQEQRTLARLGMDNEQAALAQRQSAMARELEMLDLELSANESRKRLAARSLERLQTLGDQGFLSPLAVDRESDAALEVHARADALRRSRIALARDLAAVESDAAASRMRGRSQLAAIDLQLAQLEQERIEQDSQHRIDVIAPGPGTIATVLVEPGQAVSTGMTLATIIPANAPLQAHLYAPSRSIGFVKPGQEVMLRYPAYPHQKFGAQRGRIVAVSRNAIPAADLGFSPADGSREPLYRIKVELPSQAIEAYGKPEPLKAGLQVEADILLDRRRLIEWIFEPLLSLSGRA
jgi:membrane fusion protein